MVKKHVLGLHIYGKSLATGALIFLRCLILHTSAADLQTRYNAAAVVLHDYAAKVDWTNCKKFNREDSFDLPARHLANGGEHRACGLIDFLRFHVLGVMEYLEAALGRSVQSPSVL
jgi:hypothetical protein